MFEAIINKYLKIYLQSTDFYENSHTRIPYCSINIKTDLIIFFGFKLLRKYYQL